MGKHTILIRMAALFSICASLLAACASRTASNRLTLGTIQKELHIGMSQAEVIEKFGAPNIVSKNPQGGEVWTYDKIAKESASRGFLFWKSGESTQRTLTLIITFKPGANNPATGKPVMTVADYRYHTSEF